MHEKYIIQSNHKKKRLYGSNIIDSGCNFKVNRVQSESLRDWEHGIANDFETRMQWYIDCIMNVFITKLIDTIEFYRIHCTESHGDANVTSADF